MLPINHRYVNLHDTKGRHPKHKPNLCPKTFTSFQHLLPQSRYSLHYFLFFIEIGERDKCKGKQWETWISDNDNGGDNGYWDSIQGLKGGGLAV